MLKAPISQCHASMGRSDHPPQCSVTFHSSALCASAVRFCF